MPKHIDGKTSKTNLKRIPKSTPKPKQSRLTGRKRK